MLRSDLCDYADAYILIKGTVTVNGVVNGVENEIIRRNRKITLKIMHHLFRVFLELITNLMKMLVI